MSLSKILPNTQLYLHTGYTSYDTSNLFHSTPKIKVNVSFLAKRQQYGKPGPPVSY